MATEWYLMTPPHDQLSGYESEALEDFGNELTMEVLDEVGTPVELYNFDLSECTSFKAIIQNTVQDTRLKTLTRQALVPIGSCKAGMYIKYKDRFWIITGLVDDNGVYEKAVLSLCNWYLTWLNRDGKIVQRWANVTSASQYNHGETGVRFYTYKTDQVMIIMPDDEESLTIPDGTRFVIDRKIAIYEQRLGRSIEKDTSYELITYHATRFDTVLLDYIDSGCMELMAIQDEQHESDGYYVIDGKGYWLCKEPNEETNLSSGSKQSDIEYIDKNLYLGFEPTIFRASFKDENDEFVDAEHSWEIVADFKDSLIVDEIDDCISIYADDPKLLNSSFELILHSDDYPDKQLTIFIKAFF